VNRVVPHERLMKEAGALAATIAGRPPLAIRMMKRAVYQGQTSTLRAHLDYISSQLSLLSENAGSPGSGAGIPGKAPTRVQRQISSRLSRPFSLSGLSCL